MLAQKRPEKALSVHFKLILYTETASNNNIKVNSEQNNNNKNYWEREGQNLIYTVNP